MKPELFLSFQKENEKTSLLSSYAAALVEPNGPFSPIAPSQMTYPARNPLKHFFFFLFPSMILAREQIVISFYSFSCVLLCYINEK